MFSMRERRKNKHKFCGTKVCKVEQVRQYFVNPKIENEVFGKCVNYIICSLDFRNRETVVRRCSSEYVFFNISQCSQENICVGVSFDNVEDLKVCNFIKKRLQHR